MAVIAMSALACVNRVEAALPIQSWTAASGATVLFVESHDLAMLDVSVELPAGSARDTADTSGLASLTLRLMRLGANGMDEDEIARRLADVGAILNATFDVDRAGYQLRTLSSEAEQKEALSVLARVQQSPSFPEKVLEREKARVIAGLKEADTKPDILAARTFAQLLFRNHPYALRQTGEVNTVAAITREAVLGFYRSHYLHDRAVVAIMGDVTRQRAGEIAEQLTRELPSASTPLSPIPPVPPLEAAIERVVDHPSAQSHVLIGQPGIARSDPDYFPLLVGNHILGGGGMTARLYEQVREKRGLSYSVYSFFVPYQQAGPFQIGLQTRRDQAQEAVKVVRQVLADFVAKGPTAAELEAAKQNLVGGFALRVDSNQKIIHYLAVIGFYRLPLDYLDAFTGRIEAVTLDQIRDAFARHIDPDKLATVVVGTNAAK
jgi:zinc protease